VVADADTDIVELAGSQVTAAADRHAVPGEGRSSIRCCRKASVEPAVIASIVVARPSRGATGDARRVASEDRVGESFERIIGVSPSDEVCALVGVPSRSNAALLTPSGDIPMPIRHGPHFRDHA